MLWDEPKIFFLERRYFFSIILSEFLKNRVALQHGIGVRSICAIVEKYKGLSDFSVQDGRFILRVSL